MDLKFPLDLYQVTKLIESYQNGEKLHIQYIIKIILSAQLVLQKRKMLVHVKIPSKGKLHVVGDIHVLFSH